MALELKNVDLALRIAGFNFNRKDLELIIDVIYQVDKTGCETDLKTLTKIIADNENKHKEQ